MTLAERIQMVIKMNNLTNASFADKIGVQRSSVSHVLSGRNNPSVDFLMKTLSTFPNVDANWLILGKRVGKFTTSQNEPSIPGSSQKQTVELKQQAEVSSISKASSLSTKREIEKIIIFYTDQTFETIEKPKV